MLKVRQAPLALLVFSTCGLSVSLVLGLAFQEVYYYCGLVPLFRWVVLAWGTYAVIRL